MIMEKLDKIKFQNISETEMEQIQGAGWRNDRYLGIACGETYWQKRNWFGLHGTDEIYSEHDY